MKYKNIIDPWVAQVMGSWLYRRNKPRFSPAVEITLEKLFREIRLGSAGQAWRLIDQLRDM